MTLPNGLLTLVESVVLLGGVSLLLLRRISNLAGKPPVFPDDSVDSRLEKWLPSEDQPPPAEAPSVVDAAPYCPKCGQRNFGKPLCEKCGLDFASPAALRPPEPVTGPSPAERVLFGRSGTDSLWPDVTQEWGPERASKQGMLAAFFCAGLTLLPLASSAPASGDAGRDPHGRDSPGRRLRRSGTADLEAAPGRRHRCSRALRARSHAHL
jgi:hypothetical protein